MYFNIIGTLYCVLFNVVKDPLLIFVSTSYLFRGVYIPDIRSKLYVILSRSNVYIFMIGREVVWTNKKSFFRIFFTLFSDKSYD